MSDVEYVIGFGALCFLSLIVVLIMIGKQAGLI